jgi:hypothetical protein
MPNGSITEESMRTLFLLAVVLIAAYVGYPYLTLYRIDRALLGDDAQALTSLVDFPQVRADLKAEIKGDVRQKGEAAAEKRPILGTFGAAIASLLAPAVVDSSVDALVTPEAVLSNGTVVEHRREEKSFADFVTYAFFIAPTRFAFDLKDPEKPDSPTITAVMALEGLRWRVVAVDIPSVGSL